MLSAMFATLPISHTFAEGGVEYDNETKTIIWEGSIDKVNNYVFEIMVDMFPVEKLVLKRSRGGLTDIGFTLGDWIEDKAIPVEIVDFCGSACANAAIKTPKLSGDGALFFHLAYLQPATDTATKNNPGYQLGLSSVNNSNKYLVDMWRNNPYMTDSLVEEIISHSNNTKLIKLPISVANENKKVNIVK